MDEDTGVGAIAHNAKVQEADKAKALLLRLQREFAPLLRKRKWKVRKLQEMCCCAKGGGVKRGAGTLGMCHTGRKNREARKIEVRLRHPQSHGFFDFESNIVGTFCHELVRVVGVYSCGLWVPWYAD